jgi:hypothetical protein
MRVARHLLLAVSAALLMVVRTGAVTPVPSVDGQFWDIQDTSTWAQDSGGIATGGRANPFNGFGYLKLEVSGPGAAGSTRNQYLNGFGLAHDGAERFDSITPLLRDGIVIARAIFAPRDTNYLRYIDTFLNSTDHAQRVRVAWGGAAGAFEDGGRVTVAATSSGDRRIDPADSFVTVMQNARNVADPLHGPSGHGPSAHVLGNRAGALTSVGDMYGDPFTDSYPGYDPAHIGYVFTLTLAPGQTAALMTFVVKGLSEVYDPRGGYPIATRDALLSTWSEPVYSAADARVPAAGSEIARVSEIARQLAAQPDLRGLTARQRQEIVNWTRPAEPPAAAFTVFEQSVLSLQDAMRAGTVTSEDLVREYLTRLTLYDRHGPTFRSLLSVNPRAVADARVRDAERAAGSVKSPCHQCRDQPGRAGVRHRHLQFALEPEQLRIAGHHPDDARADQPGRGDAAQHL